MHPDLTVIHDVAYKVLDIVGVVGLVNSICDLGDENVSTKGKAGHIFQSAAGVFTLAEEAESEGCSIINIEPGNKIDLELIPQLEI